MLWRQILSFLFFILPSTLVGSVWSGAVLPFQGEGSVKDGEGSVLHIKIFDN